MQNKQQLRNAQVRDEGAKGFESNVSSNRVVKKHDLLRRGKGVITGAGMAPRITSREEGV